MSFVAEQMIALFLYPGLLLGIILGLLYGLLLQQETWMQTISSLGGKMLTAAWGSNEGTASVASMVLVGASLALLPWPLHPSQLDRALWVWAWAALEAAFLLPLLPALLAGVLPVVRAAIREAQMGVVGRTLLWLSLTTGLLLHHDWNVLSSRGQSPLLAHLLAFATALFAFPIGVGWGPFAAETAITPGGIEYGLDRATVALAHFARMVRTAGLLAASIAVLLPLALLPPWGALLLVVTAFGAFTLLLRHFSTRLPRLTLVDALRLCWWRILPLGLATIVYLSLVQ